MKRTLGGDRIGAGKKMQVDLQTYNRSTHDLGYIWRSTMACGTLVPFIKELALRGDTFDFDLDVDVKTHPTIGPLFGSYKVQVDLYVCPIRLYVAQLHNNDLGVGMKMNTVKLPQIGLAGDPIDWSKNPDNQQINPSCIFNYLDIRGIGDNDEGVPARYFNGVPFIAYWDIYKNYYANKQEEIGAVIHNTYEEAEGGQQISKIEVIKEGTPIEMGEYPEILEFLVGQTDGLRITYTGEKPNINQIILSTSQRPWRISEVWQETSDSGTVIELARYRGTAFVVYNWRYQDGTDLVEASPQVHTFPLENIDKMRTDILRWATPEANFEVGAGSQEPYVFIVFSII